jgi:toxin FitB
MNVVDSSGWLEYFADGVNADFFAPAIENTAELVVPSISVLEVFKRIRQQRTEDEALQAIAVMAQGRIVELDVPLALNAARISIELNLPMADALILATARENNAVIWTQDADFAGLDGVRYIPKK